MKNYIWKKISSKKIKSDPRIKIRKDFYLTPNGKKTSFTVLEKNPVVAILPINKISEVIVVEQYRPAVNQITIDLPGGGVNVHKNEKPFEAARRELKEETGYEAAKIYFLGKFYADSGRSDQIRYIFAAEELKKGVQEPDEFEFIKIKKIPLEKILDMIKKGKMKETVLPLAISIYGIKKSLFEINSKFFQEK